MSKRDIVERLRGIAWGDTGDDGLTSIDEAAAEIERLRGEVDEWRRDGFTREAFESMQRRATAAEAKVAGLAAALPLLGLIQGHVSAAIGQMGDKHGKLNQIGILVDKAIAVADVEKEQQHG